MDKNELEKMILNYINKNLISKAFNTEKNNDEIKTLLNNTVKTLVKSFDSKSYKDYFSNADDHSLFGKYEQFYIEYGLPYILINKDNNVLYKLEQKLANVIFDIIITYINLFTPKKLDIKNKQSFQELYLELLFKDFEEKVTRKEKNMLFRIFENDNTFISILGYTIELIEKLLMLCYRKSVIKFVAIKIFEITDIYNYDTLKLNLIELKLAPYTTANLVSVIENNEYNKIKGEINV